jgi:RNA polymerase II subunit A small phosphatase-like protein
MGPVLLIACGFQAPTSRRRVEALLPPLADPSKKCLVLDLDETLVHSSLQAVRPVRLYVVEAIPFCESHLHDSAATACCFLQDAGVSYFTIPIEIEGSVHDINVIRRPGLDEFMRKVGALYEVVVFTASLAKVIVMLVWLADQPTL